MATRLFVCYDGSAGAANALETAVRLFPGADAVIAYAWRKPLPYGGIGYGGQIILPAEVQQDLDAKAREQADQLVEAAAHKAREDGLEARGQSRATTGPIWRELLGAADDASADVIVAGSRGFGEIRALLLGSTSQALAHHARRPLLIVPAPAEE